MRLFLTGASGFIGIHLVRAALQRGHEVLNIDIKSPPIEDQEPYWRDVDIMDAERVQAELRHFAPDCVIHLAARTDCDENTTVESGYTVNTTGTSNVLAAVRHAACVKRLLVVSTQYVFNKGPTVPEHDQDFCPRTVYGQSKIITEQLTRAADLDCTWAIMRPTNVWGPWHVRQRDNFFYALQKGLYVHPGGTSVTRSYGYVGNVVHQMLALLNATAADVHGKVFYLGDEPLELLDWVNAFSRKLKGRPARVVPSKIIKTLARVGDGISRLTGKPFLITSTRFKSMTEPYVVPMGQTFAVTGPSPYSLEDGVERTAAWLHDTSNW